MIKKGGDELEELKKQNMRTNGKKEGMTTQAR